MRRRLLTGAWSADLFWRHVQKGDGCWEWQGTRNWAGYGLYTDRGTGLQLRAHRVAWEMTYGERPDQLNVCHKCDNPPCVRPDHLFLGDQKANISDAVTKGRKKLGKDHWWSKIDQRGVKNKQAKLRVEEVIAIRNLYFAGASKHSIAPLYGIHPNTVNKLASGRAWSHLPGGKKSDKPGKRAVR